MPRSTGQSARLYWPQLFNPACAGRVLILRNLLRYHDALSISQQHDAGWLVPACAGRVFILRNLLRYHDAFSIFQQHDAGCLVPAYTRPVLILRSLLQGG